jgi:peptide/nickel transport system ATP-binding protein
MESDIILKVSDLTKWFSPRKRLTGGLFSKKVYVKAVDHITFKVRRGEIFGLVGESGCGKTTTGRLILRLIRPTSGSACFEGRDVFSLEGKDLHRFRREAQMIFQDPYSCLSPRLTTYDLISEPLKFHAKINEAERRGKVIRALNIVDLPTTDEFMKKHPPQLSGGQRQRVMIARSLILSPKLLIADEPVSMLDASLKSSILNLLLDLRKETHLTYVLITHDLSVTWYMCDHVSVMYLGKIVESGTPERLIRKPIHPYTQALTSAVPTTDPSGKSSRNLADKIHGEIPALINPPSGCRFHPRCPYAKEICKIKEPEVIGVGADHTVACHLYP